MLSIRPNICSFKKIDDFMNEFEVGKDDLILTHEFIYEPFIKGAVSGCDLMFQEKYGLGEPSNRIVDKILADMEGKKYKRIIAIGGGSIIDIAKLLVIKDAKTTLDIFERKIPLVKDKELIIIPTTCGTGSEVTNLSIVEIKEKETKMGLAAEAFYADYAVLIADLVKSLPFKFFVFSSIDALIHAFESYLSPKSNCYTELFSVKAIEMILKGYIQVIENGEDYRFKIMNEFLIASNYAGVAFGNTGVGAVHALSYPLGGNYHVPHGEANYQFFSEVIKKYSQLKPDGKIAELNDLTKRILNVKNNTALSDALEITLSKLIAKKKLREYGMKETEIDLFTDSVLKNQQRLLVNNYTPFTSEDIKNIYKNLY